MFQQSQKNEEMLTDVNTLVSNNVNSTSNGNTNIKYIFSRSTCPNKPVSEHYKMNIPSIKDYFDFNINLSENNNELFKRFCKFQWEISKQKKLKSFLIPKKKIISIHDTIISLKDHANKTSTIINPKNPFLKDEILINYDEDSEEEKLEAVI